jgi:peptidoglycan/xylan/chitin deacetylase (PgdA/CDA1 family)
MDISVRNSGQILALNYHSLSDEARCKGADRPFSVTSTAFLKQIDLICELQIPVVTLLDLVDGTFAKHFGVMLTFDDGHLSDFHLAYSALKERSLAAAFFPVANRVGRRGFVSWEHLSEIAHNGFIIGSHGLSHSLLTKLPTHLQWQELHSSKAIIEQRICRPVTHFSAPHGLYNSSVIQLAKAAGYRSMMTTSRKLNSSPRRPFLVHRWNIREDTSLTSLRTLFKDEGHVSPFKAVATRLREFASGYWRITLNCRADSPRLRSGL